MNWGLGCLCRSLCMLMSGMQQVDSPFKFWPFSGMWASCRDWATRQWLQQSWTKWTAWFLLAQRRTCREVTLALPFSIGVARKYNKMRSFPLLRDLLVHMNRIADCRWAYVSGIPWPLQLNLWISWLLREKQVFVRGELCLPKTLTQFCPWCNSSPNISAIFLWVRTLGTDPSVIFVFFLVEVQLLLFVGRLQVALFWQ